MKIKKELLQDYLDEQEITATILARNMGINAFYLLFRCRQCGEVYRLGGNRQGKPACGKEIA